MAYDPHLATYLRAALAERNGIREVKMFGGLCFMKNDHMLAGVSDQRYMFRVGKKNEPEALRQPGCEPVIFKHRMRGIVWVAEATCPPETLAYWIELAESFVDSLPPKKPKK